MIYILAVGCGLFNYLFCMACMHDLCRNEEEKAGFISDIIPDNMQKVAILAGYIVVSFIFTQVFAFYGYGPTKVIKYILLMGGLIPVAYEDYKEKRIPNRWLLFLFILRIILMGVEGLLYLSAFWDNIKFTVFGAVVSGIILFFAYVLSRHQIGLGDIKLFIIIGMYLGTSATYFAMLVSLVIAACYGGIRVLMKRSDIKDEMAFAPFVAIGTIIILGLGF